MKTEYVRLFRGQVLGVGVTYGLTESSVDIEGTEYIRYGAFIERDDGERAEAPDIFADRRSAEVLAETLSRGSVTPVTLMDIASDVLYAKEFG